MAKAVRRVKDNPDLLTEVEQMADTDIVLQNVKSFSAIDDGVFQIEPIPHRQWRVRPEFQSAQRPAAAGVWIAPTPLPLHQIAKAAPGFDDAGAKFAANPANQHFDGIGLKLEMDGLQMLRKFLLWHDAPAVDHQV